MSMTREFQLTTPDGLTLSCAERGSATGAPLLLLHGYSDSWRSYRPLMARLPPSIRAIALSFLGHGESAKPSAGYDMADFAGNLLAVLDNLGLERAAIVGHSMGSLVAQHVAIEHPDRVSRLALIGAFATLKSNSVVTELWRDHVAALTDPVDPLFVRAFQESCLARPVAASFLEQVIRESRKMPAHVWRTALAAMLERDQSGRLHRINAPTLIVWGTRDAFSSPADQARLARGIRHARLSVHEGAGHAPHWEDPRGMAVLIAGFVHESDRKAA
jgi:non-heme chloroperoxidase